MQTQFTELTDSQWEVPNDVLPCQRKRKHNLRAILNGILYLHRTGGQWRNLPATFLPWKSVYYYFHRWSREGVWQMVNEWVTELERLFWGKEVSASLVCIDSQSVKAAPFVHEERGIDGNKKVNGRKRHILVNTLGLVIGVVVSAANRLDGQMGILGFVFKLNVSNAKRNQVMGLEVLKRALSDTGLLPKIEFASPEEFEAYFNGHKTVGQAPALL